MASHLRCTEEKHPGIEKVIAERAYDCQLRVSYIKCDKERETEREDGVRERVCLSFSLTRASCCSAVHRGQILIHFLSVIHLNLQSSLVG